jgi:hypothetical protein
MYYLYVLIEESMNTILITLGPGYRKRIKYLIRIKF